MFLIMFASQQFGNWQSCGPRSTVDREWLHGIRIILCRRSCVYVAVSFATPHPCSHQGFSHSLLWINLVSAGSVVRGRVIVFEEAFCDVLK